MKLDPVLSEIRAAREAYSERFAGDVKGMLADLHSRQQQGGRKVVIRAAKRITTIEGLERNGQLHAVQAAFVEHDGFQCGFCTSGQTMSGVAMIEEAKAGWPSAATPDLLTKITAADLSELEIRERMSGNLCRCACYPNIVAAIADATRRG